MTHCPKEDDRGTNCRPTVAGQPVRGHPAQRRGTRCGGRATCAGAGGQDRGHDTGDQGFEHRADNLGDIELARFAITDASTETAFVFGELYRRGGQWKFRAVEQGYAAGLAGLATDFGITVDDTPATPAATAPGPTPTPQPAAPALAPALAVNMKRQRLIRAHYFGVAEPRSTARPDALPGYVMFVTDGQTQDEPTARAQVTSSSYQPLFWQFMAIGPSNKSVGAKKKGLLSRVLRSDFTFLEALDDMGGRYLDNADFFYVENPASIGDDELYDLLMNEYPGWVSQARQRGLITG